MPAVSASSGWLLHFSQPGLDEAGHQFQQIAFEHLWRGIVFAAQLVVNDAEPAMSIDQLPDTCPHGVQTEIRARVEVEDDGFTIQITEQCILAEDERVLEGG